MLMAVHLTLDKKHLAKIYDEKVDSNYTDGCILIEKLEIKSGDSVLDVGCGTGRLARHVLDIIGRSGHFIGIDPMAERIKIAKEKNIYPNAFYQIGVAEELGFVPDNSLDIVYLNWVFHWVLDKEKALQEINRVLKPGGKVGIALAPKELVRIAGLNRVINSVLIREPYSRIVCLEDTPNYLHGLTTTSLIELQTDAGLKIKDIHIKLGKRYFQSAHDIVEYFDASFFGNFLTHVPETLRDQAKSDIEKEFAKYQTHDGLQFDYYIIYAISQK